MTAGVAIVGVIVFFWGAFWNRPRIIATGAIMFSAGVVLAILANLT